MHLPDQLVSQILALPPDARAELMVLLQDSLPVHNTPGESGSDEQLTAEWTEELDRRVARMRSGDARSLDAETALAQIRKAIVSGQGSSGA